MNCEALSLTGEKEVLATAIYIIKQSLDTDSGTFVTTLRNVYELFLQTSDLLQQFEETSQFPASAAAISAYVSNELLAYRLISVPIQMSEVSNLIDFLGNYRLLTNQTFTTLTTDTLQYKEDGVNHDLSTRILQLKERITADEINMGKVATALTEESFLQSETSYTD